MLPVPRSIFSENVNLISLVVSKFVESSAGLELLKVGASLSAAELAEVKFNVVLSEIPAKELLEPSSNADESIST